MTSETQKAFEENMASLKECKKKLDESLLLAKDASHKLDNLLNHSHLKSTLNMIKEDVRLMDMLRNNK